MPHGMEVDLDPSEIVLWGPGSPPLKGAESPFSTHVYCGQTAAWVKMPLDMEIGLGPGHMVLDGDPTPSPLP